MWRPSQCMGLGLRQSMWSLISHAVGTHSVSATSLFRWEIGSVFISVRNRRTARRRSNVWPRGINKLLIMPLCPVMYELGQFRNWTFTSISYSQGLEPARLRYLLHSAPPPFVSELCTSCRLISIERERERRERELTSSLSFVCSSLWPAITSVKSVYPLCGVGKNLQNPDSEAERFIPYGQRERETGESDE